MTVATNEPWTSCMSVPSQFSGQPAICVCRFSEYISHHTILTSISKLIPVNLQIYIVWLSCQLLLCCTSESTCSLSGLNYGEWWSELLKYAYLIYLFNFTNHNAVSYTLIICLSMWTAVQYHVSVLIFILNGLYKGTQLCIFKHSRSKARWLIGSLTCAILT